MPKTKFEMALTVGLTIQKKGHIMISRFVICSGRGACTGISHVLTGQAPGKMKQKKSFRLCHLESHLAP